MNPIADAVMGLVRPVLDKFVVDADKRLEAEQYASKLAHEVNLGQIEVNKVEADSSSLFVAGWRPYIGWGCGTSFLYATLFEPILRFIATVCFGYTGSYPLIDASLTVDVLVGMLGMAGIRSYDKLKGLAKK